MNSIRTKLILLVTGLIGATLVASAFLFARVTRVEYARYEIVRSSDGVASGSASAAVSERRGGSLGLDGASRLVSEALRGAPPESLEAAIERLGDSLSVEIAVLTDDDRVMSATDPLLRSARIRVREGYRVLESVDTLSGRRRMAVRLPDELPRLTMDETMDVHVVALPGDGSGIRALADAGSGLLGGRSDRPFLLAVNRRLIWVILLIGTVSIAATVLLSRRMLDPIARLTVAADGIGRGDLSHRIPVTSRDEVGRLARSFNRMSESLARSERLRRSMVSDVAHELRTPLSNLQGHIEALQDGMLPPSQPVLSSLHEEVGHLTRLVRDLGDLALADSGELTVEVRPLPMQRLIEGVVRAYGPNGIEGRRIETRVDPGLTVRADRARISQVLRNLIDNAVKHTDEDGILRVTALRHEASALIRVEDDGAGIHPDHLPHVFERLYRTDAARSRDTGGAGLGLAIVRQLVELHGGRVWAESRLGEGTRVSFTLPLAQGTAQGTEQPPRHPHTRPEPRAG